MEQRLTKLWYQDAASPSWLQPLSWMYGTTMRLRRGAYSRGWLTAHPVGKPVVIVGNLTVGGTGKTPLVIWLARRLTERGLKVGIVSRGYGSHRGRKPQLVDPMTSNWREVGDEPLLLARRTGCDTMISRDRVAAARALVARNVDVVIADDGLQHLRLARHCEIVVIDGTRGFGNARVLPAGPLREPASRLTASDLIVINGTPEHPTLTPAVKAEALQMTLQPGEAARVDGQGPPMPLDRFRDRPIHAVAGIGNPARFFRDLRSRGLQLIEHPFPDHHPLTPRDLSFADDLPVLMTEKDAVKCVTFPEPRLWFVPTTAMFAAAQARELLEQVLRKISPLLSWTEVEP